MTKAIRFDRTGGPEVMKWVDVDVGKPGEGEIRIRQHAVGLNYIDVYFRTGLYPLPLPGGLGMEAAGEVTEVGAGVTDVKVGERVAYVARPPGAYAQERVLPAAQVVKLPDAISYEDAASVMLQGLTAQYLLRRTYRVKAGDTILIQAAAGGVGLLACQWAKALGATVIGTVGSDEKAEIAKAHGCDHPIVYTRENFTKRVRELIRQPDSRIVGASAFMPEKYGEKLLDVALKTLRGEPLPPAVYIEPTFIDANNTDRYYPHERDL